MNHKKTTFGLRITDIFNSSSNRHRRIVKYLISIHTYFRHTSSNNKTQLLNLHISTQHYPRSKGYLGRWFSIQFQMFNTIYNWYCNKLVLYSKIQIGKAFRTPAPFLAQKRRKKENLKRKHSSLLADGCKMKLNSSSMTAKMKLTQVYYALNQD